MIFAFAGVVGRPAVLIAVVVAVVAAAATAVGSHSPLKRRRLVVVALVFLDSLGGDGRRGIELLSAAAGLPAAAAVSARRSHVRAGKKILRTGIHRVSVFFFDGEKVRKTDVKASSAGEKITIHLGG